MEESRRTSMSRSRESTIPRRHSTEERFVDGRHRSSSSRRRRGRGGPIAAAGHRCRSHHIDQESININDGEDNPGAHHEYCYDCQYHPTNNSINEAEHDELDFRDIFGGPPCRTTNILLRRHGISGDFTTSTTLAAAAAAAGTRSLTNFCDETFCPALRASLHHHRSDPDPDSRHEDPGGRSAPGDGSFLHSRARMRNSSRKPVRTGRNLPGFHIPSPSFSSYWAEEEMRRTSEAERAGFVVETEEGFYDDIFRPPSDGQRRTRSSRTCNCMLSKSGKSRSKSKSKASAGSSTSVLSSADQEVLVTSPPTPASAAHRHSDHHKQKEDVIFSSFASKLRPITIPNKLACRSSRGYDSSPASSTILSAEDEAEGDGNVESSYSQRTSIITINPLSATTFMDLCSTPSSPPLPPSSDHHVKRSSVSSKLFQHYYYCYHDQPNSSPATESTAAALSLSNGLKKPDPDASASASATGGHSTSTVHVAHGADGDDLCDYAPGSLSLVFLEPLAANAARTPAQDKRIAENEVPVAQEEGDRFTGADESDQTDSESSFIKVFEYNNCRTRTYEMTTEETEGAAAVDEAIAWAKEKFWSGSRPNAGV